MIIKTQKKIKSFVSFVKKFNFILKNFTSSIKFISFGISHFFFLKIERNLLAILLFQLLEHKYIDFVCLVDFSMAARVLYPSPDKQINKTKQKKINFWFSRDGFSSLRRLVQHGLPIPHSTISIYAI